MNPPLNLCSSGKKHSLTQHSEPCASSIPWQSSYRWTCPNQVWGGDGGGYKKNGRSWEEKNFGRKKGVGGETQREIEVQAANQPKMF